MVPKVEAGETVKSSQNSHYKTMNILFICTANRDRSRTAELMFQNLYPLHRFRSAGINKYLSERHGGIPLKRYMLEVADKILCMEQEHAAYIVEQIDIKYLSKIEVLNLGDSDIFMSFGLKKLLANRCHRFISQWEE